MHGGVVTAEHAGGMCVTRAGGQRVQAAVISGLQGSEEVGLMEGLARATTQVGLCLVGQEHQEASLEQMREGAGGRWARGRAAWPVQAPGISLERDGGSPTGVGRCSWLLVGGERVEAKAGGQETETSKAFSYVPPSQGQVT